MGLEWGVKPWLLFLWFMSRWNENVAWKELRRWAAAAGLGIYVAFSLYALVFVAPPFGVAVAASMGAPGVAGMACFLFRAATLLNIVAVVWAVLKVIGHRKGEWPD